MMKTIKNEVPIIELLSQESIDIINSVFGTTYSKTTKKGKVIDKREEDIEEIMQQTPNDYRFK